MARKKKEVYDGTQQCRHCQYAIKEEDNTLFCHRYPPSVQTGTEIEYSYNEMYDRGGEEEIDIYVAVFPEVTKLTGACGEWQLKKNIVYKWEPFETTGG